MALIPKDLGGEITSFPEGKRILVKDNKAVKLEAGAAELEMEVGYPLQESAVLGTYEPWATGNEISCFVHPVKHTQLTTGETLVVVMIAGDIHRDDVVLPSGQTQNNLDLALQDAELGKRGIRVFGLADISL